MGVGETQGKLVGNLPASLGASRATGVAARPGQVGFGCVFVLFWPMVNRHEKQPTIWEDIFLIDFSK